MIRKIVKYEFPQKWVEFLPLVKEMFNSNDEKKVFAGVNAYLQVAKNFEFEIDNAKSAYHISLGSMQSSIENLMETLLKSMNIEFAAIIKKLLKIYNCSIQVIIYIIYRL